MNPEVFANTSAIAIVFIANYLWQLSQEMRNVGFAKFLRIGPYHFGRCIPCWSCLVLNHQTTAFRKTYAKDVSYSRTGGQIIAIAANRNPETGYS